MVTKDVEGVAEVVTRAEDGEAGVGILNLSSKDEDKGQSDFLGGGDGNAEVVRSHESRPEKKPRMEEDGSNEEKSK